MKISKYFYRIIIILILFICSYNVKVSASVNMWTEMNKDEYKNWYCIESGQGFQSYADGDWEKRTIEKNSDNGKEWHALRIYSL